MKKILLIGRTGCGKTTLTQALRGEPIRYRKTQYVHHFDVIIDTPGEYLEDHHLGRAIALYSYEAGVVGMLLNACEPYSLYSPCCAAACNRPVIGIVTQIHDKRANPDRAERWLRLAGCRTVFRVDSVSGEGIWQIFEFLREPGDVLPWETAAGAAGGANPRKL